MAETQDRLVQLRLTLPDEPGIYKYFNAEGVIIYVGKAKSIRKRVNSYFTKNQGLDFKTRVLVQQIANVEYVITQNDLDALLLENSLIKQYQPKYNILLKDGKTYPYICLKNERFPRVFSTRKKVADGSQYYGPYPSVTTMNAILLFLRDNFKLRTCNLILSERNIQDGKFRPCLEYHIGKCGAPCVGLVPEGEYNEDIRQIKQILKGSYRSLLDQLKTEMNAAAESMAYERAHFLKRRYDHVQKLKRKSTVVSEKVSDVEVITVLAENGIAIVNHFRILSGTIVQTHTFDVRQKNEESPQEVLEACISQLIAEGEDLFKEVLTNVEMGETELSQAYHFTIPTKGDELKVLQLSLKNCEALLKEKQDQMHLHSKADIYEKTLRQLQKDLHLKGLPNYIECFDNSNIQGYAPVSSCVVFRNGRPARRDYRVFNIKTVTGPDDFASMKEVVLRRYKRLLEEKAPLPDLVVIDGGKGQLSHALEALKELGLATELPIVSIAKRLEEIYFKDDPVPLYIDKKSASLRLLQRIRNEAHNAAITYHRRRRSEKTLRTELTEIKGVGATTARKLLTALKNVKTIQEAPLEHLATLIGQAKAEVVYAYYHKPEAEAEEAVGPPSIDNLPAELPAPEPDKLAESLAFYARRRGNR